MNHEAVARLNEHISNGTLVRRQWTDTDGQGRRLACLLAAMVPECGEIKSASPCPADVMPSWLAHLTPWIDDAGSAEAWPGVVRRYAAVAARWHALSPDQPGPGWYSRSETLWKELELKYGGTYVLREPKARLKSLRASLARHRRNQKKYG